MKQRSHSARPHEYRERERGGHADKSRKPERTKEEKHRHKERKHEKHSHGDHVKKDYESREVYLICKHTQLQNFFKLALLKLSFFLPGMDF